MVKAVSPSVGFIVIHCNNHSLWLSCWSDLVILSWPESSFVLWEVTGKPERTFWPIQWVKLDKCWNMRVYIWVVLLWVCICVCARVCAKALCAAHTMHIELLIFSELRGTQFMEREIPSENLLRLSPSLGRVYTCCCWMCLGQVGSPGHMVPPEHFFPSKLGGSLPVSFEETRTFYIILAYLIL